jgi:hypothetical protein
MVWSFEVKIELAIEFWFEIIDQRSGDIRVILCHQCWHFFISFKELYLGFICNLYE